MLQFIWTGGSTSKNTTITSNVSSITTSTLQKRTSIQIDNIKEHIARSLEAICTEFSSFQENLRKEMKLQLQETSRTHLTNNNIEHNVSTELSDSFKAIKEEFKTFRSSIQD